MTETIHNVIIEVTDHSLIQLYDRYNFDSFKNIIDDDYILLYPDVNEKSNIFYFNIKPKGFVVLRRTKKKKFVAITITLTEQRNFNEPIKIKKLIIRERQGEYEL